MVPAIMLIREGSRRLPRKWSLDWHGKTLARHASEQTLACPVVSTLHYVTDSHDIAREASEDAACRVWIHPGMSGAHTSLEGVRWACERAGLEASYILLVQCTAPFINPTDLERLILLGLESPGREVWGLTTDIRNPSPSGMAWLVPPWCADLRPTRWVQQDAPGFDIDERGDYEQALVHTE